jgi:mitochondrial fission protein ELM1
MDEEKQSPAHNVIWALLDDQAGNRSQCLGVVDALGLPYVVKEVRYSIFARLPNSMLGKSLIGLSMESRLGFMPPWPDVVIAAGRRIAPIARVIKEHNGGRTKLVQIMYPGKLGIGEFDLIAVPTHDEPKSGDNILPILGSPHGITLDKLSRGAAEWCDEISALPAPRIAVLVGGSTRRRPFTPKMGRELGRLVNDMAEAARGSLMISTSRRTGQSAEAALLTEITVAHHVFRWGQEGENPYQGYLALADGIVVTGDSVSMCSEACTTEAPVYIYAPPTLITDKHARLHQLLYVGGYARPLCRKWENWCHPRLNSAESIVEAARDRLGIN